jgi:Fur family transcriptional regulator, ferric uptake regulator
MSPDSAHVATGEWVERAEATLAAAGHRRGGARRALLELLAETGIRAEGACLPASASQECALTAQEIEEALREGGARGAGDARSMRGAGSAGGARGKSARVVSRASVYRILDELEGLGLVQRVETGQAMVRYERVCEHAEHHHHHLVCDECGVVMPFSDPGLERAIATLSERVPLAVSEHEIVLHGACRDCAG